MSIHQYRRTTMAGQDRFYVDANGIKLHFLEYGNAHVYVLDNRGRGLSDQRNGLGHATGDYAADAAGVIEALQLAPAIVLGHSMGARIAARLCAERPDLVSRCVLADPPVSGPGRRPYPSPIQKYLDDIDKASRGEAIAAGPNFTPAQVRLRREWLPTCNKEAIALSHRAFHEEDMFADLEEIKCPTLLIQAGVGDVIRDGDADEILSRLQHGSKIKVEGAGHMIPFDALEAFIAAVEPFVRG
jgi:N-formylmaleamate deformylase